MPTRALFRASASIALLGICAYCSIEAQQAAGAGSSPYAHVDEATARKLVKGCSLPSEVSGPGEPGSQIIVMFTVSEKGKLLGVRRVQGAFTHELAAGFAGCHFSPYKVNDVPTAFQTNVTINVKR